MLTIELKLNGKLIGGAEVTNVSALADVSSYEVLSVEKGSDQTGLNDFRQNFQVQGHPRKQTVWALVHKVALASLRLREAEG